MIKKFQKLGNSKVLIISNDILKVWSEKYQIDVSNLKVNIQMNDDLSLTIKPFIMERRDKIVNE